MTFFGIYKTTNKVNGKMYIGLHITDDLDDGYIGSGKILKYAIKKYGEEAFTKEWLEFAENAEDLNYLERMYVNEEWLARPDTYNLVLGGAGAYSNFKKQVSTLTRQKMSTSAKKRRKHKTSEKTKEKLRIAQLGKKLSAEARAKISAKAKGRRGVWKGKHLSDDAKAKISAKLTGTHLTEETKCKISKSLKGKPKTAEENEKNRQAHLGKHHSEEAKKKMSDARKKYFELKRNLQCKN